MIIFSKINYVLNDKKSLNFELQKIYGIGSSHLLFLKIGFLIKTKVSLLKLHMSFFDIELDLLKKRVLEYALRQQIRDFIRKKIIKKTYQGIRHKLGLPVHGQRTHSNSKTMKRLVITNSLFKSNLRRIEVPIKKKKVVKKSIKVVKKSIKIKKKK